MVNVEGVKNIEVEILVKVLNTTIFLEKSLNEYLIAEYPLSEIDIKYNNFLDTIAIEEIQSKYAEKDNIIQQEKFLILNQDIDYIDLLILLVKVLSLISIHM